jgi:hypothetical protein
VANTKAYETGKGYGAVLYWLGKWAFIIGFICGVNALFGRSTAPNLEMLKYIGYLILILLGDFFCAVLVNAFRVYRQERMLYRISERIRLENEISRAMNSDDPEPPFTITNVQR